MSAQRSLVCWVVGLGVLTWGAPVRAIEIGQIDDFQGGTTAGWRSGPPNPNPPAVAPDMGPAGSGDHALRVRSTGGNGPGSMLVTFNTSQWAGSYTDAGVGAVALHARNASSSTLHMRVTLAGPGGHLSSSSALELDGNSAWQTLIFPISEADLTAVSGSNPAATLDGVVEVRLLHHPSPSYQADSVNATLLVDNIIALPLGWMAGDSDLDRDVDAVDLTNLTLGWTGAMDDTSAGRTLLEGDADGDLDVDAVDFTTLVLNWTGAGAAAVAGPPMAVPEPAGLPLGILCLVGGWHWCRRRQPRRPRAWSGP